MDRRSVISAFAAAPVLASSWAASAANAARFAPPPTPMRLERTLIRHLRGGAALTVTRRWDVRFSGAGRGFLVSGRQVDASVNAPPALAAMAQVEEARVDDGMFPLTLDHLGHIMGSGNPGTIEAVRAAAQMAQAKLTKAATGSPGQQAPDAFLLSLQQAGSEMLSDWPRALFNPAGSTGIVERKISTPGQPAGLIRVETRAQAEPDTGLLRWMTRQVETRIGESTRMSEERWKLVGQ